MVFHETEEGKIHIVRHLQPSIHVDGWGFCSVLSALSLFFSWWLVWHHLTGFFGSSFVLRVAADRRAADELHHACRCGGLLAGCRQRQQSGAGTDPGNPLIPLKVTIP